MSNDQIQIVKDDLAYILDLVEGVDRETNLKGTETEGYYS